MAIKFKSKNQFLFGAAFETTENYELGQKLGLFGDPENPPGYTGLGGDDERNLLNKINKVLSQGNGDPSKLSATEINKLVGYRRELIVVYRQDGNGIARLFNTNDALLAKQAIESQQAEIVDLQKIVNDKARLGTETEQKGKQLDDQFKFEEKKYTGVTKKQIEDQKAADIEKIGSQKDADIAKDAAASYNRKAEATHSVTENIRLEKAKTDEVIKQETGKLEAQLTYTSKIKAAETKTVAMIESTYSGFLKRVDQAREVVGNSSGHSNREILRAIIAIEAYENCIKPGLLIKDGGIALDKNEYDPAEEAAQGKKQYRIDQLAGLAPLTDVFEYEDNNTLKSPKIYFNPNGERKHGNRHYGSELLQIVKLDKAYVENGKNVFMATLSDGTKTVASQKQLMLKVQNAGNPFYISKEDAERYELDAGVSSGSDRFKEGFFGKMLNKMGYDERTIAAVFDAFKSPADMISKIIEIIGLLVGGKSRKGDAGLTKNDNLLFKDNPEVTITKAIDGKTDINLTVAKENIDKILVATEFKGTDATGKVVGISTTVKDASGKDVTFSYTGKGYLVIKEDAENFVKTFGSNLSAAKAYGNEYGKDKPGFSKDNWDKMAETIFKNHFSGKGDNDKGTTYFTENFKPVSEELNDQAIKKAQEDFKNQSRNKILSEALQTEKAEPVKGKQVDAIVITKEEAAKIKEAFKGNENLLREFGKGVQGWEGLVDKIINLSDNNKDIMISDKKYRENIDKVISSIH